MPRLAEELLALIVDIVADRDDGHTLSQLALVSHQLLTLVRERRSAALIIGGPGHHSQSLDIYLRKLLSLIQDDPTFAECVISLTLSHDAESAKLAVTNAWTSYSAVGWLAWSEVTDLVTQILLQLPFLRNLTITSHTPDAFIDWTIIPPELQDALFHCFSLLSLDTLVLDRIMNMEITPLIDCSNIRSLSLTGVSLSKADLKPVEEAVPMVVVDGGDGEVRTGAQGHLRELEVGDCGIALGKLLEGFEREDARLSVSGLRKLTVHAGMYDGTMEKALKTLLHRVSGSIEEIRVRVPVACDRDVNELKVLHLLRKLERFPRLTSLDLDVVVSWCAYYHDHKLQIPHSLEPLEAIIQAVGQICEGRHPESVRLDLVIESNPGHWGLQRSLRAQSIDPNDKVGAAMLQSELWPLLDSALGSVSNGTLSVEVAISTPLWGEATGVVESMDVTTLKEDALVEKVYAGMPHLVKNGILNVYCISDQ